MDTGGTTKQEQTIKGQAEELWVLLDTLVVNIDNLVERNPKPAEQSSAVQEQPSNVFDEIMVTLNRCRCLIREATGKVQDGISHKVH